MDRCRNWQHEEDAQLSASFGYEKRKNELNKVEIRINPQFTYESFSCKSPQEDEETKRLYVMERKW